MRLHGTFSEAGLTYEALLPEHEGEPQQWLLRVRRGTLVLVERRFPLTWAPRFGPDQGDVAHLDWEADLLDSLVQNLHEPEPGTDQTPTESLVFEMSEETAVECNPMLHAMKWRVIERYVAAYPQLGLSDAQAAVAIGLSTNLKPAGLYPVALRPRRYNRMQLLSGLAEALASIGDPTERAQRVQFIVENVIADRFDVLATLARSMISP